MAGITGARHTLGVTQGTRAIDMRAAVLELEPDAAPLTVLSGKLPSERTVQTQFQWVENELQARFDAINNGAGYTNSATSVVVDDGTKFAQWDLLKVTRTGEVMRVDGVSSNTLTVARGIGGGAAAILDNDELLKIGSSEKEGADVKPAVSTNPTIASNYVQIQRQTFEETETLLNTKSWNTPGEWERAANLAGIEHKKSLEYTRWLGKASEVAATDGKAVRTTAGAFSFIATNVTDMGGTMTEAEFFGTFRSIFRYGNKQTKTLFCSTLVADVINAYATGKLEVVQSDRDTTYGLSVSRFTAPAGTLNVITHPLFEGSKYGGYGAVLDLSNIRRRFVRDTRILTNRQGNGMDTRMDEYLTEDGLEFGLEKTHGLMVGITG